MYSRVFVYVVFVKMSANTYFCLSSSLPECLPLGVRTRVFPCEYVYVYRWKGVPSMSGHGAHAGHRSGHRQLQPAWHPLPQSCFGEHSLHHDRGTIVTEDAHSLTVKGWAPNPSPRLSPQNWNLEQNNNKGWNSSCGLCPKGTVSDFYSLDPEGVGPGASFQGHRSRNWHTYEHLHNFPAVKFCDSGTILQPVTHFSWQRLCLGLFLKLCFSLPRSVSCCLTLPPAILRLPAPERTGFCLVTLN